MDSSQGPDGEPLEPRIEWIEMDRSGSDVPRGHGRKNASKRLTLGSRHRVSGDISQVKVKNAVRNFAVLRSDETVSKPLAMKQMRAMADDDYQNVLLSLAG